MRFTRSSAAAVLAASAPVALAQTFTDCNPLQKTCPADPALQQSDFSANFLSGASAMDSFSAAAYSTISYGSNGAEFSIAKDGQAPTVSTDFYFLFGRVDVKMRAAPGTGIVSSIVLESDDLDEVDWEFVGGDTAQVQSNFFGKGNTTLYDRVQYIPVSTPQDTFHTYTVDWNADRLQWIIDGNVVRTLEYNNPLTNGGSNYPQTPMRLKLGNWCGGCAGEPEGTVQWAGGQTTFDGAPYVMYVESVQIHTNTPCNNYVYGDNSGSWQSIQINGGSSSSNSSSGSSSSASGSATSIPTTATAAPTSSIAVHPLNNTLVVPPTTVSSGSTATATGTSASGLTTSHVAASTQVPSQTSQSQSGSVATPTGAASVTHALTGASLLSIALAFFLL